MKDIENISTPSGHLAVYPVWLGCLYEVAYFARGRFGTIRSVPSHSKTFFSRVAAQQYYDVLRSALSEVRL